MYIKQLVTIINLVERTFTHVIIIIKFMIYRKDCQNLYRRESINPPILDVKNIYN